MHRAAWLWAGLLVCGLSQPLAAQDTARIATITFAELLRVARAEPPQVLAAYAASQRAQAERQYAEGAWLPALTGEASAGYTYDNRLVLPDAPRIDSASIDARATMTLEWAALDFARNAAVSSARASARAERFSFEAAQRNAAWLASELYLRAGAASALVADAEVSLTRRSSQLQATLQLVEAGTRSPVDAERAKIEVLSAQFGLTLRRTEERAAFAALAAALGRPATALVRPAEQSVELPEVAPSPARAQALALQHRPEVRGAAELRTALRRNHDAALDARLPTLGVSATGSVSYLEVRAGDGIDGTQYGGSAGVYLRWQGFDPAVWIKATVAAAELGQAERERRVVVHEVASEVVRAFYARERARTEHARAVAILAAAQVTREAQEGRYRAGLASLLELLDTEDLEQQARQRRIESERDRAIASAHLAAACGVL
jgi:outer membrane protein TolC